MTSNELKAEFARVLGCSEKFIQTRLIVLGHGSTCGRCGGGGSYSFCQQYGTTCFGCNGSGKAVTKLTEQLLETVRAQVDSGALEPYVRELKEKAARRAKVAGMANRIQTAWESNPTIAAHKGIHFTRQSARCTSINHFCAPLSQEANTLIRLVEQGEWSKEIRKYVPVNASREIAAIARLLEIEQLIANAEQNAPDVEWSKEKNAFVEV